MTILKCCSDNDMPAALLVSSLGTRLGLDMEGREEKQPLNVKIPDTVTLILRSLSPRGIPSLLHHPLAPLSHF